MWFGRGFKGNGRKLWGKIFRLNRLNRVKEGSYLKEAIFLSLMVSVLAMALMMGDISVKAASVFQDVEESAWYYNNVMTLTQDTRGIIKGYPDGRFMPMTALSKDQFITMVVRACGFEPGNGQDYWAQNYIDKALEIGLLEDGDFNTYNGTINREEMSMIVVRAVQYLEGEKSYTDLTQVLQVVNDSEDFTYKYRNYIMQTYQLGIITGYPDHTFRPQGVLNRSEASAVVVRLINPNERIRFDYEALYKAMYTGLDSHLLGGANWLDPVAASVADSAAEDWSLITSDMEYGPSETMIELNLYIKQSSDYVDGALMYDENGPYAGHLEDFERLLKRRMPQDQVDIVMKYLEKKTDKYTYLEHDQVFFYLDNDKYLVRIDEVMAFEGTKYEQAMEVNFNIWYRDTNFINEHEEEITQIMPYTDVVIHR